ncbi:MAG: glycosyltransferase family 2 protein [Acidobacteria bacterium]|nr:glycosyltransferase family 2 protein [Acidobacteriota bacterium]
MSAQALVSVVVLNHNGLRYLDECLASLVSQTYAKLEIILPQKIYWVERNRFWLVVKNFPPVLLLLSPLFTAHRFFWNFLYALSGKGAAGNFRRGHSLALLGKTILSAYADGLRQLPPVWKERRRIRRSRRLTDREFLDLMWRFKISARDLAARD